LLIHEPIIKTKKAPSSLVSWGFYTHLRGVK